MLADLMTNRTKFPVAVNVGLACLCVAHRDFPQTRRISASPPPTASHAYPNRKSLSPSSDIPGCMKNFDHTTVAPIIHTVARICQIGSRNLLSLIAPSPPALDVALGRSFHRTLSIGVSRFSKLN